MLPPHRRFIVCVFSLLHPVSFQTCKGTPLNITRCGRFFCFGFLGYITVFAPLSIREQACASTWPCQGVLRYVKCHRHPMLILPPCFVLSVHMVGYCASWFEHPYAQALSQTGWRLFCSILAGILLALRRSLPHSLVNGCLCVPASTTLQLWVAL